MDEIKARLSEMIGVVCLDEVNKITASVVKEAASLMFLVDLHLMQS